MTPLARSSLATGDRADGHVVDLYGLLEQPTEEEAALAGACVG
jgi:hypothetical protein